MNNKGQTGIWEGLIIILLLIALGGMVYLYVKKPTVQEIYQAESKPNVSNPNIHPLCGLIFDINGGKDVSPTNRSK